MTTLPWPEQDQVKQTEHQTHITDSSPFQLSAVASEDATSFSADNRQSASTDILSDSEEKLHNISREPTPPPLPPRPETSKFITSRGSLRRNKLQGQPTTALSLTGVQSGATTEDSHDVNTAASNATSRRSSLSKVRRIGSAANAKEDDGASIQSIYSYAPTTQRAGEIESLLGGSFGVAEDKEWHELALLNASQNQKTEWLSNFEKALTNEFQQIGNLEADGSNEEALLSDWSDKLKHFLILSSAGKPIYSRHGEDYLISNTVGVIQTILSFYQDSGETLKTFNSGKTRFVLLSKGHLHLVAISQLDENDAQLLAQLEALYMQILSTLTLPSMEKLFFNRPSIDLRRPLQGTESLLSALADSFTRGSPSTLLSSLECLRLRKSQRQVISDTFVRVRISSLLYGLIVAGGRLVSVLRPKKHSLHPGDLQLVFNMLFEAQGMRSGGGENWVPLCLPGFNNTGYVYMYVSFLDGDQRQTRPSTISHTANAPKFGDCSKGGAGSQIEDSQVAIILISTSKDAFYDLRMMRDKLVDALSSNNALHVICKAARAGRQTCSEILPGTPLRHFLYKSRANVQFTMPAATPDFDSPVAWRRLMSQYAGLHAAVHGRSGNAKVVQGVGSDGIAIAWVSPVFELFAVATQAANRQAVAQGAAKAVQWAKREEERLFVIGGAVF